MSINISVSHVRIMIDKNKGTSGNYISHCNPNKIPPKEWAWMGVQEFTAGLN